MNSNEDLDQIDFGDSDHSVNDEQLSQISSDFEFDDGSEIDGVDSLAKLEMTGANHQSDSKDKVAKDDQNSLAEKNSLAEGRLVEKNSLAEDRLVEKNSLADDKNTLSNDKNSLDEIEVIDLGSPVLELPKVVRGQMIEGSMAIREPVVFLGADGLVVKEGQLKRKVQGKGRASLGLSMIVKNEDNIILNCLNSVVEYLDYWVIHDTGSTDRTIERILEFFSENRVPGELHFVPWQNFGWNRTCALERAKKMTDYCLLLDADFVVRVYDRFFKDWLVTPGYMIKYEGGLDYRQILLIGCDHPWKYYGVTHEYIDTKPNHLPVEITDAITIVHTGEGTNRKEKYRRDIELLLDGIKQEPQNSRYYFYLAQSYKDSDQFDLAIEVYRRRMSFDKWDEEVFYSCYQIGICKKRRGDDFFQYVGDFLKAYNMRPHRIEPLYQILDSCCRLEADGKQAEELRYIQIAEDDKQKQMALTGFKLCRSNMDVSYPTYDLLFIEKPLYDWMYLDLLATCAFKAGLIEECYQVTRRLLEQGKIPQELTNRFSYNLRVIEEMVDQGKFKIDRNREFNRFVRLNQNQKSQRIAVMVANYNMPERTDNLVRSICNLDQNFPIDLIVVDNGSDLVGRSIYSVVSLAHNVQTTHAWLAGLNFADSLEKREGFKYLGYCFVITSAEIIGSKFIQGGFVGRLAQALDREEDLVGVHPALTIDSTTSWPQLITGDDQVENQNIGMIRQVNMIDNIFSCYRANWFNRIGRFDPNLTMAWGIDLETSYLARRNGKKLAVLEGLYLRKTSNIGYRMNRMKMTSQERVNLAGAEMNQVLSQKYGQEWRKEILGGCLTQEVGLRRNYDTDLVEAFNQMIAGFERIEGSHSYLINQIRSNHCGFSQKAPDGLKWVLLEIGATANDYPHLGSTRKLALTSAVYGYQMISVDLDSQVVEQNKAKLGKQKLVRKVRPGAGQIEEEQVLIGLDQVCQMMTGDGVQFCRQLNQSPKGLNVAKRVRFVFIDAYDHIDEEKTFTDQINAEYQRVYDQPEYQVSNQKAEETCLDICIAIDQWLIVGGVICLSDFTGKNQLAYKWLLGQGGDKKGEYQLIQENNPQTGNLTTQSQMKGALIIRVG